MAASAPPAKKRKSREQQLREIDTRNRAGLGWSTSDFGTVGPPIDIPGMTGAMQYEGLTGTSFTQQRGLPQPSVTNQLPTTTSAQSVLTPAEIERVRTYMKDPEQLGMVSGALNATTSFLGKLFDLEDEKENPVEWAWDGFWRGMTWPVDQVNHLSTAAVSALPGGMPTLTWEQSQQLSAGQALVTDVGTRVGRARRGEASLWDVAPLGAMAVPTVGALMAPDSPVQQAGFDPLSAQGKATFETGYEKFFSGVTDFGMAFADPLIVAGKVGKIARIKYVDRIITTPEQQAQLGRELQTVYSAPTPEQAAPVAQAVRRFTEVDDSGNKVISFQEIYDHPVIKKATNREALASALYNARDVVVKDILDPNDASKMMSMSGYDLGSLIIRWGYGDMEAAQQLARIRADIADGLARADRNRIAVMHALNPDAMERSVSVAEKAVTKANGRLEELRNLGLERTDDWNAAVRARDIAEQTMLDLQNGQFDFLQYSTPDAQAISEQVFKALVANDNALASAIGRDSAAVQGIGRSLQASTKGFAVNTRVGRAIEQRRARVGRVAYETAATRGALRSTGQMASRVGRGAEQARAELLKPLMPWQRDTFGNGFTRYVHVWRRASQETPSGFIITKGIGAQESLRELRANLNDIRMLSGPAKKVILDNGDEILVGGTAKKEQLLSLYAEALGDEGVEAASRANAALDRIEQELFDNLAVFYGISKDNATKIQRDAFRQRAKTMDGLTSENRKFWIDESGDFNVLNDPWVDSQVANGRYLINYREFERRLADLEKGKLGKLLSDSTAFVGRNVGVMLGWFNDIWRPLVLLRLGYTARNNIEGQFRAWAMTGSLDPFNAAVVNAGYSAKSLWGRLAGYRNMDRAAAQLRIDAAKTGGKALPRKFEPWLRTQINGHMNRNANYQAYIAAKLPQLSKYSTEIREWSLDWYSKTLTRLSKDAADARAAGRLDEAEAVDETINGMIRQMDEVDRTFVVEPYFPPDAVRAFDDVKLNDMMLEAGYRKLDDLGDEAVALSQFFRQGAARSRAYSGSIDGPDGRTLYEAFNPDNPFTPVALSLLSSDSTFKSLLSGRTEGMSSFLKTQRVGLFVDTPPGTPTYWDSLAVALEQVRFSQIGERIMRGETDDDIVRFLLKEDEGRQIMRFLNGQGASKVKLDGREIEVGGGGAFDRDTALFFTQQARFRYEKLTANPAFRQFVETAPRGQKFDGKALKKAFDENGGKESELSTVVGAEIEDFGPKNVMQAWRDGTALGMRWLGTIPEDTFTRSPFYGARYQSALNEMVRTRQAQPGDVSMTEIDFMMRQAHRRALKDTKDWLYTIDRPTALGRLGETSIPFISAAQNSMTTLGRLVYNDPAVAVVLADLWRAPSRAGFEDEEGNIVLPIPHEWIPDGVEKAFGLDAMKNLKIKKGQLNVIIPESGFAFVPRPGPVVGVLSSEIMKKGWLDYSVESPDILRTVLGSKENADWVWNTWKSYVYGEGQGVAPEPLSYTMLAPPAMQKVIQTLQGENSTQFGYWYNSIMRTEWAKWSAGMRETVPTKDELMKQTIGFQMLRLIANLTAITPPTYDSYIDPLVDTIRYYERTDPNNSNRIINEKFGPILQMLGDFSNSKNVSGMYPYADSVEQAQRYSDLIGRVAPELDARGDLSVLTMLTMSNANQLYDDSAYGWQFANTIPGTNRGFREWQTPDQSWVQSDVNAGWATFLRAEDQFDARLRQSGATSYRGNKALKEERAQFINDLGNNPLFANWFRDYKEFGSSRTLSSIYLMETLVNDQQFMADNANNEIWQLAPLYLYHRNAVVQELAQRPKKGIDSEGNEDIREYWDQVRSELKATSTQWAPFVNRFLNGDDDPESPGVTFGASEVVQ